MNERIEKAYAQRPKRWVFELSVAVIVTALIVWSATAVETSGTTQNGGKIALNILSGIFHPDTGLLFNLTVQGVPYLLLETVCIAFLGTVVGAVISIPLAFLSASNLAPKPIAFIGRIIIMAVRTVPAFIYGLMFIRVTGPGAFAGLLTMSLCSVGMVSKMYIEAIEDLDVRVLESLDAAGCGESSGLLNLAAQIDKNGNTLVLDGGDSLQGTPLVQYYLAHADEFPHHPVAEAFNAMGCDYFTLGNHDFNFGYDALRAYLCAMDGVCLCANVQDLGGALPLLPETVHTLKNGLRIGITGIVTDYVNVWEQPQNLKKLRITEAFDAARAACARLRPICDICVCIYHGGFEEDLHTGAVLSGSGENLACRIARELDFDLLLTGHQHMPVESVRIGGTFAVQPPANAGRYLQVEAAVRDGGAEFSARLLPVGGIHREQPYRRLLPLEQAAQRWLDEPVGHLEQAIPPEEKLRAALHGSAVAALFNQVQLSHTGADISCTSLGNEPAGLAASVTMRAITAAYLFSNTLVVLEITEEILRALLERCASYFTLENGTPRVSDAFLAPKVEHYNYDFFAGISYQFDLRQPVGRRLTRLSRLDGTPLGPGPLRLCTSNYRATGTGGYDALRICPVLWRGSVEMPELVAEYVRANSPVSLPCNGRMEAIW